MKLSDLTCERYLLGELPPRQMQEVEELLRNDPAAAARIEALKKSNREIRSSYPADLMSEKIRQRALYSAERKTPAGRKTSPRNLNRVMRRVMAPAAAAAFLVISGYLIVPHIPGTGPVPGSEPGIRIKGTGGLFIYRQGKNGIEHLKNMARVKEGDLLQIAFTPAKGRYAAIFSVDGRGAVTLHYPRRSNGAAKIVPGKRIILDASYELDDAPAYERFFLVTSPGKFSVEKISRDIRRLAADPGALREQKLPLPDNFLQESLILLKR